MDPDVDLSSPTPLGTPARRRPRTTSGRPAGGGGGARNHAVGVFGETVAARHLESLGLVVVDRNWRCELGEIDLVALEPDRRAGLRMPRTVVVCEVKTRTTTRFGGAAQQVTHDKAAKLRRLASRWVQEHPRCRGAALRVDVVGVRLPVAGAPLVDHLVGVSC